MTRRGLWVREGSSAPVARPGPCRGEPDRAGYGTPQFETWRRGWGERQKSKV